jgi:hypothetical protein
MEFSRNPRPLASGAMQGRLDRTAVTGFDRGRAGRDIGSLWMGIAAQAPVRRRRSVACGAIRFAMGRSPSAAKHDSEALRRPSRHMTGGGLVAPCV